MYERLISRTNIMLHYKEMTLSYKAFITIRINKTF